MHVYQPKKKKKNLLDLGTYQDIVVEVVLLVASISGNLLAKYVE